MPAFAIDLEQQVLIEAASGVDYDMEQNITTANQDVKLTRDDITVYANRVVYYGNTGVVEASGNVRLTNPAGEYRTEKLRYNIFQSTGDLEAFTATLSGEPRDFQFKGQGIDIHTAGSEVKKVVVTRCPKKEPDYTLNAKWVKINGKKVQLKNVVLKAKGVSIFYFPLLSFYTDKGMPELEPGYNTPDGLALKGSWVLSSSDKSEWKFKGDISQRGKDSFLGVGNVTRFKDSNNQLDVMWGWDELDLINGWLKLADKYTYDTPWVVTVVDGFMEFSAEENNELGIRLTRKYWKTQVGDWQISLLARKLGAVNPDNGKKYGGTYTGFQLDYRLNSNLKLSYLKLGAASGDDFSGLMKDYGIGGNALYEVDIPLKDGFSLEFDGTYNLDQSK